MAVDREETFIRYEWNGVKFTCIYYPGGARKLRPYPAGLLFKSIPVAELIPDTAEALYTFAKVWLAKQELSA